MTLLLSAKSERIVVIALLTLAAVLRIAAAVVLPDQSNALVDALAYRELAERLWSDGQIGGCCQMPLYPLLIAIVGPSIGQFSADIALSVVSVWLIYALADQLFSDQYARIFAMAAAASYWLHRDPYGSGWHYPLPASAGAVADHFSWCWRQSSGPLPYVGKSQISEDNACTKRDYSNQINS